MGHIKGIHHVALKTQNAEEFEKVKDFYGNILGLPVAKEWPVGIMFETGAGRIEVFNRKDEPLPDGTIRHFSFAVDSVDAVADIVRKAGYPITVEPKDVDLPCTPVYPIRVGFCRGPLGEEIELFQER